ncbi:MAG: methyltransferase domain-containing protein [Deltaproteobacteria bacterium]|nr:methyltransferase domain-containing protein [Deltaproteobacteria bacterium]
MVYDVLAPLYDLGVWFLALFLGGEEGLRDKAIAEAMPLEGKTVLEIFAGTGTISLMAAKRGAAAVALDISEGMLRVAGEKAGGAGAPVYPIRADAVELPFRPGSFDRVIASMGLHEVGSDAAEGALKEAYRVLKTGGRLVIFDYSRAEGAARVIQALFFAFAEGEHARGWIGTDVDALLTGIGFRNFRRKFLLKRALQVLTVEKR